MTATQRKEFIAKGSFATEDVDGIASIYYGMYDRITDWGRATANVVVAPATADGQPDWDNASPLNLENPSSDSGPSDMDEARRWAVLVDEIDGCDAETSMLLWIRPDDGQPSTVQIAGPEADAVIASNIIVRDIMTPPPPKFAEVTVPAWNRNPAPVAANDNKSNLSPFRVVDPTEWHGQPVPDREWFLPGLVPARNVTLLSGDGGVGKSLLALQIGAAAALGTQTLGLQPSGQKVFYLGAEDEEDEFHRRLAQIVVAQGRTLADLQGRFRLAPMAGEDATLMLPDSKKNLLPTGVMAALIDEVASFAPDLLILDTSADLFGGDEINRVQVRQFVGALRKIAMAFDCAIILLAHPSVQGMQSGSGLSGSTAWNNSVRSRLYLTAAPDDDAARVLTTVKSNYGKKGDGIKMRWDNGSFTVDDGKPGAGSVMMAAKAERVFVEILSMLNRQGRNVCHVPGTTYAPAVMAKMPEADGVPKDRLVNAMNALLRTGEIKIVKHGSASRERQKLIVASEDFGPNEE